MPASPGINELIAALNQAGVPLGSANGGQGTSQQMQMATPALGGQVQSGLESSDSALSGLRKSYLDQLSSIHEMDKKLASVYLDPSSKLAPANPWVGQKLISGAIDKTGYGAANAINSRTKERIGELSSESNDAVSLYKTLTAMQKDEETKVDKLDKQAKATGNKSVQVKVKASLDRSQQMEQQKMQLAGFADPVAYAAFDKAPAAFKHLWLTNMQSGATPEGGFTLSDVKANLDSYNKTLGTPKKAKGTINFGSSGGSTPISIFGR